MEIANIYNRLNQLETLINTAVKKYEEAAQNYEEAAHKYEEAAQKFEEGEKKNKEEARKNEEMKIRNEEEARKNEEMKKRNEEDARKNKEDAKNLEEMRVYLGNKRKMLESKEINKSQSIDKEKSQIIKGKEDEKEGKKSESIDLKESDNDNIYEKLEEEKEKGECCKIGQKDDKEKKMEKCQIKFGNQASNEGGDEENDKTRDENEALKMKDEKKGQKEN